MKEMLAKNKHEISLVQKYDFHSLAQDYKTLYENFSLLSYIERTRGIHIHDRFPFKEHSPIQVDQFYIKLKNEEITFHYLFQMEKDDFGFDRKLNILYRVGQKRTDCTKGDKIKVIFYTEIREEKNFEKREYVFIKIIDQDGWIQKNLRISNTCLENRISERRELKPNEIEYYYQEPELIKTKVVENRHLSIALQGGGSKGVAYIGVFQALKKFYQKKVEVKSVIGTSAGGILGLGICLSLSREEIIDSAIKKLSKITEDDKKEFEDLRVNEERLLTMLKEFILEYNMFDSWELQYIDKIIRHQHFQKEFLECIEMLNPSLVNLFTFVKADSTATVYGLLEASLMTGNIMKEIAINFLRIFHKKHNQDPKKKKIEKKEEEWAQNVTFAELFEVNQVEFTCTAVDLRDSILRFFNHKTAPNLPVWAAVQMTGSFPVVFESQVWKKDWGKYYVHYSRTRKEIDLEGVKFTDGGTLANFPVKFLDNEEMRSMYFSHKRYSKKESPENQTLLYGFGVYDVSEQTLKEGEESKLSRLFSKLFQAAKGSLSIWDKMKVIVQFGTAYVPWKRSKTIPITKDNNPTKALEKIPLFDFLSDLLLTYQNSRDKLTLECFANQTLTVPIQLESIEQERKLLGKYDHDDYLEEITRLISEFEKGVLPHLEEKQPLKTTQDNFRGLLQLSKSWEQTESNLLDLEYAVDLYLCTLCSERAELKGERKNGKLEKFRFYQKIIQMSLMKKQKVFYKCSIRENFQYLQETILSILQYFEEAELGELEDGEFSEKELLNRMMDQMYQSESLELKTLHKELKKFKDTIQSVQSLIPFPNSILCRVARIRKNCTVVPGKKLFKIFSQFRYSSIANVRIYLDTYSRQKQIQEYVMRTVNQNQGCDSVHVVFQSAPLAEQYVSYYLQEMEKVFSKFNQRQERNLRVKSMTTTNFYSIAAFLHASDFSRKKVSKEICDIHDLIEADPNMQQNYDSKMWEKINTIRMKELQKYVWENRKEIYQLTETKLGKVQNSNDFEDFRNNTSMSIREEIENTRDQVNEVIEDSLYYVLDAIGQLDSSDFQNVKKIEEKLSLKSSRGDYEAKNNKKNDSINCMFSTMAGAYGDIFKYMILQQTPISSTFNRTLTKEQIKDVFKGFLTGRLLTAFKVKSYVCQKLEEMGLKRTTTLKEYYELTSKHIHLNMTAVELPKNVVTIINHKTRPYMPVWAAIVASCSLPLFFKPLSDRMEWKYAPETFQSGRIVNKLFSKTESEYSFLQSADLLVKFPLELVTNEKLRYLITNEQKEMFLNFAFEVNQLQGELQMKELKIGRLNFATLNSLKGSAPEGFGKLAQTIPLIRSFQQILQNYVNSHDNLIKSIYQDELAILPIHLGTVDFHKTVTGELLSKESEEAIEQAEYVVKEKLLNEASQEKRMFFKASRKEGLTRVKFFSFFNDVRGLAQHYHISFKHFKEDKYHQLRKEQISFNGDQLWLRIQFPELVKKDDINSARKRTYFHRMDFSQLLQGDSFVYQHEYSSFTPATKINPEDSDQRFITVNSYFDEESFGQKHERSIHCNKCSHSLKDSFIINEENEKCYNKHALQRKLKVECRKCSARFCVWCKFSPEFRNEEPCCPFGHEFEELESRFEKYREKQEICFIKCDYCGKIKSEQLLKDERCQVTICMDCVLKAKSS